MSHKGDKPSCQGREEINLSNIGDNCYDVLSNKDENDHTYDDIKANRTTKLSATKQSGSNGQTANTRDTTLQSESTVSQRMMVLAVTGSLLLSTLISVIVGVTVYHVTIAKMSDSDKQDQDRAITAASQNSVDTLTLAVKQLENNLTAASNVWNDEMTSLTSDHLELKNNLTAASNVWNDEMTSLTSDHLELKNNLTAASNVWNDEMTSLTSDHLELKNNLTTASIVWNDEMTSLTGDHLELKNNLTTASNVWNDEMTSLTSDHLELKNNLTTASNVWNDEMTSLKHNLTDSHQYSKDCSELYATGTVVDGVYTISPDGRCPFQVYCDMTGGGWTLIQKRIDGLVGFYRSWDDYVQGFGNIDGEHWLGLDKIHRLSVDGSQIYFHFEYYNGTIGFAHYHTFTVHGAITTYRMNVDVFRYNGTINELLSYHNNMKFSTYDRDNDALSSDHCALVHDGGGWWYKSCYTLGNLNGVYGKRTRGGIAYWDKTIVPLKSVYIKIKPSTGYC